MALGLLQRNLESNRCFSGVFILFWFLFQALLALGANVNVSRTSGGTPLYIAAQMGHSQCVEVRTKNKA